MRGFLFNEKPPLVTAAIVAVLAIVSPRSRSAPRSVSTNEALNGAIMWTTLPIPSGATLSVYTPVRGTVVSLPIVALLPITVREAVRQNRVRVDVRRTRVVATMKPDAVFLPARRARAKQ